MTDAEANTNREARFLPMIGDRLSTGEYSTRPVILIGDEVFGESAVYVYYEDGRLNVSIYPDDMTQRIRVNLREEDIYDA